VIWDEATSENSDPKIARKYLKTLQEQVSTGTAPQPDATVIVDMEEFSLKALINLLLSWNTRDNTRLKNEEEGVYYTFQKGTTFITTGGLEREEKGGAQVGVGERGGKRGATASTEQWETTAAQPTTYWRYVSAGNGGRIEVYVDGADQIPNAFLTISINPIKGTHAVYKGKEGTQFNFETTEPSGDKKLWGARFNINTGKIEWYYWNKDKNDWVATRQPGNVGITTKITVGWGTPEILNKNTLLAGGGDVFSMTNAPEWLRKMMAQEIRR